jgi:ferredoxin
MSDASLRLGMDWIACNGYGACALAAPDLVELDDWGYPVFDQEHAVPDDLLRQARRAVADCPMLALSLEPARQRAGGRR